MFESLLLYIDPEERDLVRKALLEDLLADEHEELLNLFYCLGVKPILKKENVKPMLLTVTHKLIIQQPKKNMLWVKCKRLQENHLDIVFKTKQIFKKNL